MKASKAKSDTIVFAVLLVAAIFFYVWGIPSQIYMTATAKAELFSPDTFPRFATLVFIISAGIGLIISLYSYFKAIKEEGKPVREKKVWARNDIYAMLIPYIVFVLCVIYAILFRRLGVILATALIPPIVLFAMKCRKWHYYIILYAFSAILYVLFKFVLLVPLR